MIWDSTEFTLIQLVGVQHKYISISGTITHFDAVKGFATDCVIAAHCIKNSFFKNILEMNVASFQSFDLNFVKSLKK